MILLNGLFGRVPWDPDLDPVRHEREAKGEQLLDLLGDRLEVFVRLWPLALDVIEAAQAHIPDRDDHSKSWFDYQEASQAFCAAAERERA